MNILVLGSGAREHVITWKLAQNKSAQLYNFGPTSNPGIAELVKEVELGDVTDVAAVVDWAKQKKIDVVWVGPEAPLAVGIVDALEGMGVSCIGPTQKLAELESSKSFTRNLVEKYNINASPIFRTFTSDIEIEDFIKSLDGNVVIKPDGLTGGKGVKVMGDHFQTADEALQYCKDLFAAGDMKVLVEEKLIGQEFSLMSFTDGKHIVHMPVVQDHKRAYVNDEGPNTGGMGSYTDADHSLPFLNNNDVKQAEQINEAVLEALEQEFEQAYIGILYGGFIAVHDGVRLIEYNVRFGDPEVMNLLSLLETDLIRITDAMVNGTLNTLKVEFSRRASVCKYLVPDGYPVDPIKDQPIDVSVVDTNKVNLFFGSVDQKDGELIEKGSRTVAVVGIADTLREAEQKVETEIKKITGPLFHREDIGTNELIQKRIESMNELRHEQ
ncbi:MAG: phosphoribosylamine--glycine ligase [bacterium]|nr:phosphoribosylamine--glycine ligase [bacterium]